MNGFVDRITKHKERLEMGTNILLIFSLGPLHQARDLPQGRCEGQSYLVQLSLENTKTQEQGVYTNKTVIWINTLSCT